MKRMRAGSAFRSQPCEPARGYRCRVTLIVLHFVVLIFPVAPIQLPEKFEFSPCSVTQGICLQVSEPASVSWVIFGRNGRKNQKLPVNLPVSREFALERAWRMTASTTTHFCATGISRAAGEEYAISVT